MRCRIGNVGYESTPANGKARVIISDKEKDEIKEFNNAIEGWNYFQSLAMYPFERRLRDELEANGFNRWTGVRGIDLSTESERKHKDDMNNLLSDLAKMKEVAAL